MCTKITAAMAKKQIAPFEEKNMTVEPRYSEPLYNEVFGITNDILHPSNSQIHEKEPRYNETSL